MSLRLKFALLFSLLVSVVLLSSILIIYFLYTGTRKDEFNKRLWAQSIKTYQDYYKTNDLDKETLEQFETYYPSNIIDNETFLLDKDNKVIYSNKANLRSLENGFRDKAKNKKTFYFNTGKYEGAAVYFPHRQVYVVSNGYDKFGKGKVIRLRLIILFVAIGGIVVTGIFSFFYVQEIIKPITKLGDQMQSISENNLKERVRVSRNKKGNELSNIAFQFNDMLDRFEKAFELQKSFVHHASHELRTPLATMLSQTESALRRELTAEQAKVVLESLKEDQQELIELTNSLLLLSQYERVNFSSAWPTVRLDEALYETIGMTKKMLPDINISMEFACIPETEDSLSIRGNDTLLKSAFRNLLKNAYLYSDNKNVIVTIDTDSKHIYIHFDNDGRVLSEREQENLFIPFFRGGNAQQKKGFGLGLSIVNRIATLHKAEVKYSIHKGNLNRFTFTFHELLT